MSRSNYYAQKVVHCDCGSTDAYWHGDTLRVYCCDACWTKRKSKERK